MAFISITEFVKSTDSYFRQALPSYEDQPMTVAYITGPGPWIRE